MTLPPLPDPKPIGLVERSVLDGEPNVVTEARAVMLALHANHVQGGASDPEREKERAEATFARNPDASIDWARLGREVDAEYQRRLDALVPNAPTDDELQAASRTVRDAPLPDGTVLHHYGTEDAVAGAAGLLDITEPADEDAPPLEPGEGQLPVAKVRRYLELRRAQTAGEAEAKAFKDEANALEGELVEAFGEAGMQNINIDGSTVYLHRSTFAIRTEEAADPEVFKAALREAGAGDLIGETINAQTLNAYVRELLDDDEPAGLPEPLKGMLDIGEKFAVRVKASASKAKRR